MKLWLFWVELALLFLMAFSLFAWSWVAHYDPLRVAVLMLLLAPLVAIVGINSGTFVNFKKKKKPKSIKSIAKQIGWAIFFVCGGSWAIVVLILLLNQSVALSQARLEANMLETDVHRFRKASMQLMFPAYGVTDFSLDGDSRKHRVRHRPAQLAVARSDGTIFICRATGLLGMKYFYFPKAENCT